MPVIMPILLIRRKIIIKRLKECGANSPETAKNLAEAGVINPDLFSPVTESLIKQRKIHRTSNGKYYI